MSRFKDWVACPECDGDGEVGVLAHNTEIVFECYGCGYTSEFTIGQDVPFNGLDPTAIKDVAAKTTRSTAEHQSRSDGSSVDSQDDGNL